MARRKGSKTRKANPAKSGPKGWSLTDREAVKAEVAKLDRRGYNQYQIAAALGRVSQATVCNMLKEIRADYQAAYVDDRKAVATEATTALREVNAECWMQIDRLKREGKKRTASKDGENQHGTYNESLEIVEDADIGGYLSLISKNWSEILAIHGVKALPEQVFNIVTINGAETEGVFNRLLESTLQAIGAEKGRVVVTPEAVEDKPADGAG